MKEENKMSMVKWVILGIVIVVVMVTLIRFCQAEKKAKERLHS